MHRTGRKSTAYWYLQGTDAFGDNMKTDEIMTNVIKTNTQNINGPYDNMNSTNPNRIAVIN
jgi:hypothetical protein